MVADENGQKDPSRFDLEESNSQPTEVLEEEDSRTAITEETLLEVLANELESNRGKMLHLDYPTHILIQSIFNTSRSQ
jgi:hypothetical protein